MAVRVRTPVSGPMIVEGEPTGDGRMVETGALTWDGVLPFPIVFDCEEGDHTAAVIGAIEDVTRRSNGVVWGDGYLEDSDVPEFQALVNRAREILEQGAVGVSLRMDSETVEVRVKRELIEIEAVEMASVDAPETEYADDESRVVVARYSADDVLYVTTAARIRHLAIVDTAASIVDDGKRFGVAASGELRQWTGAIAASALAGDWSGHEHLFDDPKFGDFATDPRLRYDPDRGVWSCPPTVTDDGRFFGHITPMGICLRGRPDKCVNPPDGDLDGFMRGRAPAAGGRRTGVVVCGEGSSHCDVGIGAAMATMHYDKVGKGAADVRVGKDRYGIWFSGMVRPGTSKDTIYELEAGDVSGHWEYTQAGRMTLVGLPAVNIGGFPKGYMTYDEYRGGLAAAGGIKVEDGCGSWYGDAAGTLVMTPLADDAIMRKLDQIGMAVGEMYAAHIVARDTAPAP